MRTVRSAVAVAATGILAAAGLATAAPAAADDPLTSSATLDGIASVEASYSDTTVSPGDAVGVTVEFTNLSGFQDNAAYILGDSPGAGFGEVFESYECTPPAGVEVACVTQGGLWALVVADLPDGVTTIDVDLTVRADATPDTYSYVQRLFKDDEETTNFSPPLDITVRPPEADVAVALDATAGPLLSSQISYDLTAANQGPDDVDSATVVVDLPSQTNSVSGLPSGCSYSATSDEVTCATGSIANGDEYTGTFRANLGLLSVGQLNATATRTASSPADPNAGNDAATANCTVVLSLIIVCN